MIDGYEGAFDHIGTLSIAAIESIRIPQFEDIRLLVEQVGNNPMHLSIKGFPENIPANNDKIRLVSEHLAEVAVLVKQSEWVHLVG